jgi:hypothetical protein
LKGFSSEPIDGTGDKLLLNVLTQLIVKLETFFDVAATIIAIISTWCLGRGEEVEE